MARPGLRRIREYSREFKVTAVRLSQQPGIQVQAVAAALDIHPFMLSKWRKQVRDGVLRGSVTEERGPPLREIRRLQELERAHARLHHPACLADAQAATATGQVPLTSSNDAGPRDSHLPRWKVMPILSRLEREVVMTDRVERPTPHEATAALDSIDYMARVALKRGLHSRRFAAGVSLWVGAMAVATAYDGPVATRAIVALLVGGFLGVALWRRQIVARVRDVHGVVGSVVAAAVVVGVLVIGLLGARAFEVYDLSWVPFASGGVVTTVVYMALHVLRRATHGKLAAGDA